VDALDIFYDSVVNGSSTRRNSPTYRHTTNALDSFLARAHRLVGSSYAYIGGPYTAHTCDPAAVPWAWVAIVPISFTDFNKLDPHMVEQLFPDEQEYTTASEYAGLLRTVLVTSVDALMVLDYAMSTTYDVDGQPMEGQKEAGLVKLRLD
jgi:hypothetical protein